MNDIVNLRIARKRAKRRKEDAAAAQQRLTHGVPKPLREAEKARRDKAARDLDSHKLPGGDDE